ncbi:MAG: phospholipase D family protein [Verrucomicrobiales bacterium]|nr:phospholipase D family protein [Verrucomicrobiales bacterium]
MAKFLNTSAANYYLEELIKNTRERLVIISPFLKVNERVRQMIEDLDRLKIDIRIVYGKSELAPKEIKWLQGLSFVRTSYCDNLHAKCYLNENSAILTSLNLYEFSQVNNNEMGVHFTREDDSALFSDTYEEAMRIIRVSDEVKLSADVVEETPNKEAEPAKAPEIKESDTKLLSSSKLAKNAGIKTDEVISRMKEMGFLEDVDGKQSLTEKGRSIGAKHVTKSRFGAYFLWPETILNS